MVQHADIDHTGVAGVGGSTSVLANEIQNFPSIEKANDTQPEWWEESAGTATLTEVDVVGESITETFERCLKVVTTADVYAYQRYTYADEPRLKSGRTVSCRVAVWAVGGVTARVRLQSSVGSLGVSTTTAAAWTELVVTAVVLDGTNVELRLEVNNGTAYFVPLAFGVGNAASGQLPPRGLGFRWSDSTLVKSLTGLGDENVWTDIDCTTATSPLAAVGVCFVYMEDTDDWSLSVRRNGSSAAPGAGNMIVRIAGTDVALTGQFHVVLDDQQIFEYYLDRSAGSGTLDASAIYITGWLEWE